MHAIDALSLVQPALVVHDIYQGVERVRTLFEAEPSERNQSESFVNAVYAFQDTTFLELLDGLHVGHTRDRFLQAYGPGMYMLCVDIADGEPDAVTRELAGRNVRVVAPGMQSDNIRAGWHLHPRDAGNILVLLSMKRDPLDNGDWAGRDYRDFVENNTRWAWSLSGVLARTEDPVVEAEAFGRIGLEMQPGFDGRCMAWSGSRTRFELWPADAWGLPPRPDGRRDYTLLFSSENPEALAQRLQSAGLELHGEVMPGRVVTSIDPVLGIRFAIESQ